MQEIAPFSDPMTFIYRCKSCRQDLVIKDQYCPACQSFGPAYFHTTVPDGAFLAKTNCCGVELLGEALPRSCECGSIKLEWYEVAEKRWHQPNLSPEVVHEAESFWVSGEIDADMYGVGHGAPLGGNLVGARFISNITGAVLRNPERVHEPFAPPLTLADDEQRPIRQSQVSSILVEDRERENFAECALRDVRIHRWEVLSSKVDGDDVLVRVRGKAYGRIVMPDRMKMEKVHKQILPLATNKPLSTTEGGFYDSEELKSCLSCSLLIRFLLSLLIWWLCGAPLAALSFVVTWVTCLQEEAGYKFRVYRERARFLPWALLLLSLAGLGWYLWQMFAGNCQVAPWWSLLLPALALLVSPWVAECRMRLLLLLLFQVSLLVWCAAAGGACHIFGSISNTPASVIVSPAVVAPNSGSSTSSIPLSATPSVVGITSPGAVTSGNPVFSPNPWASVIESINQLLGEIFTGVSAVSASVGSGAGDAIPPGSRISLDQALNQPELFASCEHSVYMPSVVLFDYNQSDIRDQVKPSMQRLVQLLQRYPNDTFEITGHSDRTGERTDSGVTHNLQLSQARANSMGEWLSSESGIPMRQFTMLGLGTRIPITVDATIEQYNRRVELKLRCHGNSKRGGQ